MPTDEDGLLSRKGRTVPGLPEDVSFEELDRTYRPSLLRYFRRRAPDPAVAEDMVQQVFERLVRHGDIDGVGNIGGYVFQIARNVITDDHRERTSLRRNAKHEIFVDSLHGGVDFSPHYVLSKREKLARAMALLQELPERTRVIFVLQRLEGMKYREIAAQLGISMSAVEKHIERAVAHLTKGMGEQ